MLSFVNYRISWYGAIQICQKMGSIDGHLDISRRQMLLAAKENIYSSFNPYPEIYSRSLIIIANHPRRTSDRLMLALTLVPIM
jgi:hypothetical protein